MKIETIEVSGLKGAIKGMRARGYKKTKTGYETFVSVKQKKLSLGTYKTEKEAVDVIYAHRLERFLKGVEGLNVEECVSFCKNYVAFKSGEIFNLHGVEMKGAIDRGGYREVIINGKKERVHRIIALCFLENNGAKKCVNHIDGNKTNNNVKNLEWCTHSENTQHSFMNGLQKKVGNKYGSKEPLSIEDRRKIAQDYHLFSNKELAKRFNVCEKTIRKYKEFK